jgi:hypothetical protein
MYFGPASPALRNESAEPHRSEINGVYFDGGDYMSMQYIVDSGLVFNKYFTVEMWVRFTETNISQPYYLFQKVNALATPTAYF